MSENAKRRIADYLDSHRYLALATVSPDGSPSVHTMGYVAEGSTVYCATFRNRRKVRNISQCGKVAYVVNEHYEDPDRIQGVQVAGRAEIVEDPTVVARVAKVMMRVFPPFAKQYPSEDIVFIRIEPVEALFIDFSVSLDHSERVTY